MPRPAAAGARPARPPRPSRRWRRSRGRRPGPGSRPPRGGAASASTARGVGDGAAADRARRRRGRPRPRRPPPPSRPSAARRRRGRAAAAPARWMPRASASRHVLGPRRLEGPLDQRVRHPRRVAVGQVGLHRHLGAHLLPGGDQQRRVVRLGVEDRPHGVADARRGVQVDVRGAPRSLRVAVGHPDRHRLLQAEHVAEVLGEVGQHRQLGRAGVAEDRRHAVLAEEVEGCFAHDRHRAHPTTAGKIALRPQVAAPTDPIRCRMARGGNRISSPGRPGGCRLAGVAGWSLPCSARRCSPPSPSPPGPAADRPGSGSSAPRQDRPDPRLDPARGRRDDRPQADRRTSVPERPLRDLHQRGLRRAAAQNPRRIIGCPRCHVADSDHKNGLALDIGPASWSARCDPALEGVTRLAHWAEPRQNRPRAPFRWVGYEGDANHGCGHHLHLSWNHAEVARYRVAPGSRSSAAPRKPGGSGRTGGPSGGVKPGRTTLVPRPATGGIGPGD